MIQSSATERFYVLEIRDGLEREERGRRMVKGGRPHFYLEESHEGAICWEGNMRGQIRHEAVTVALPLGDPSGGVRQAAE